MARFLDGRGSKRLAPDNVELATTTALLRIDIVGLTGRGKRATQMIVIREAELRRKSVAHVTLAKLLTRLGSATVGVATLNHEVADDTMKESAVVEALGDELKKIVAVYGSVVEQGDTYGAHGGLEPDDGTLLRLFGADLTRTAKEQQEKNEK